MTVLQTVALPLRHPAKPHAFWIAGFTDSVNHRALPEAAHDGFADRSRIPLSGILISGFECADYKLCKDVCSFTILRRILLQTLRFGCCLFA